MPDFNVQYPNYQANQMSLGDMLNLARGAQAYQQAQQVNPLLLQKAQQELATAQQQYQQAQKVNPEKLSQEKEKTKQEKMSTEKQGSELRSMYADKARQTYGGLLTDPDFNSQNPNPEGVISKLNEAHDYLTNVVGVPEHESKMNEKLIKHIQDHGVAGAQRVIQTIANGVQQGQTLATQGQQLNQGPTFVSSGQYQVPVWTSPYQGGGVGQVPAIKQELAPGSKETIVTDPTTQNQNIVTKDSNGNIINSRPMGQGGNTGFTYVPQGETSDTLKAAKNIQLNANASAIPAQNSLFNSNKIIDLADKAFTGVGADVLSKLGGGYAALPWTSDSTSNMQVLGHQMALETANLAAQSGLGTDSARSLAAQMAGTTNWTPDAIKQTARMNRALSTGTLLFNEGVNNAVKNGNNSPFAARDFQNKWANSPNLVPTLQFVDAVNNKDKTEIRQIIDSLGGPGSKGAQELLRHAQDLKNMVGGQ